MHIIASMTCFLVLAYSHSALALDQRSEAFYQAEEEEHVMQWNAHYGRGKHSNDIPNFDIKIQNTYINFSYEYGMSDLWSLYAQLGYGEDSIRDVMKMQGLDPLQVGTKYRFKFSASEIFTRLNMSLGLWDKFDCDGGTASAPTLKCNRIDQSINLSAQLGYILHLSDAYIGASLQGGLVSTKGKNELTSDDIKKSAAVTAKIFYERLFEKNLWGGSMQYSSGSLAGTHGNSMITGVFYGDRNQRTQSIQLKTYTRIPINETLSFLGSVYYEYAVDYKSNFMDSGHSYGAQLGLRYSFD